MIGSKDETTGNNNAQISHIKDNLFNLKLNINHKADKITDKYVNIKLTLNHEVDPLINIIKNNNIKKTSKNLNRIYNPTSNIFN